jgi:integrase
MNDLTYWWKGWNVLEPKPRPPGGDELRKYNRREERRRGQLDVLEILKEQKQWLIDGTPGKSLTYQAVQALLKKLYENCDGRTIRNRHNFFVKGLKRGVEELGWDIPLPGLMIQINPEPSPFTPEKFAAKSALDWIHKKFLSSIADPDFYNSSEKYLKNASRRQTTITPDASQLHAGQILVSAVINGGMLNAFWVSALGDSIARKGAIIADKGLLWVELEKTKTTEEDTLHRRWFPDPLTALLLFKWIKKYGFWWPAGPYSNDLKNQNSKWLIKQFFKSLGIAPNKQPSLYQLLSAAETRLGLQLPQFIIKYAAGIYTSPSLPPDTWARLYRGLVVARSSKKQNKNQDDSPQLLTNTHPIIKSNKHAAVDQLRLYRKLQSFFSYTYHHHSPRAAEVNKCIASMLADPSPLCSMLIVLAEWCQALLRPSKKSGKRKIKPSSIHTYLSAIGRHLILHGAECNIETMDKQDWESLYDQVLELSPNKTNKAYKVGRLIDFHRFLMMTRNVPSVEIADVGAISNNADINLLTPQEFHRILFLIKRSQSFSDDLKEIQSLLTILGYRCGLRRNEALFLKVKDVQDENDFIKEKKGSRKEALANSRAELLVRNNIHRTVKSRKSIRRVPLGLLLTKEELSRLRKWKQKRLRQKMYNVASQQEKLLFARVGHDNEPLADAETFRPIQEAMKKITGDPTMRFHHLRHSFCNFLLLQLCEQDWPGLLRNEWKKLKHKDLLPPNVKREYFLLTTAPEPSKKLLYIVGQACGHIDPKESLASYIHLLDYITGGLLHHIDSEPLSLETQATILGVTRDSLKTFRSRKKLKHRTTARDLFDIVVGQFEKKLKNPVLRRMTEPEKLAMQPEEENGPIEIIPSPDQLYGILYQTYMKEAAASIATRFGFPKQQVEKWINNAKELAKIKSGKGLPRLIRHAKRAKLTGRQLAARPELPGFCPALPHGNTEKKAAQQIYNNILQLSQSDPSLVQAGLQIYFDNITASQSRLHIYRGKDKISFVRFLQGIGLGKRIFITLRPNQTTPLGKQKKYWAQQLGLPQKNILVGKRSVRHSRTPFGSCLIWVAQKNRENEKPSPAPELRFALFMGGVYLMEDLQERWPRLFGQQVKG